MDMITLTENAKNQLSSIAKDDYITLGVNGGGCSGFQYVWDYKKNWPDVKWSEPYDNCLVLDPMAEMFVDGCTIDYVTELGGSYLKVINPNATASCGCGESFAVQEKIMPKLFKSVTAHEPTKKGTSQGRKPITSTMNKNKRRSFKSYRGQGRS